ncbi:hypothetical protein G8A07_02045 [Roseateles sp. DAIF2]|uniref:hypothetical protein n=1 Tax=Roseateles sp. DAIF2 TaxID=2714952 RepID=UPI0018A24A93|nr:hypothetical protein [Roseateles sp. DAIF2]QPF71827.1 hypothetical protein G8A07_02045 [Roseateles sp. DAIF2]
MKKQPRLPIALGLVAAAVAIGAWLAEPERGRQALTSGTAGHAGGPMSSGPPSQHTGAAPLSVAAPPAGSQAAAALQQQPQAALRALKRCYYADSCGFPETDSRSAHFAAAHAIAAQLRALPREGGGNTAELGALAREFLAFPDGHVQEAALRLAAGLPPDAATVAATIAALADNHDAPLFRIALPILEQWQKLGLDAGLDSMLGATLRTGGLFAAQTVAEQLTPFVNEANWARYQALAAEMPEGARRQALQQSLREYQLRRSGG